MSSTAPVAEHDHLDQRRPSARGEPAWDLALLYPPQGYWTERDYLGMGANWMVEFDNGFIEVLPMPTWRHQRIVRWLYDRLSAHVRHRDLGEVMFAPLPVRLWAGKYREPDLLYLSKARAATIEKFPDGADLAVEVVSEGAAARERDLETKRAEYAAARIPEYWIVDPEAGHVTVLVLDGDAYRMHGVFTGNDLATSHQIPEFAVPVAELFAAANGNA